METNGIFERIAWSVDDEEYQCSLLTIYFSIKLKWNKRFTPIADSVVIFNFAFYYPKCSS